MTMKTMKTILGIFLALALLVSLAVPAFAVTDNEERNGVG